MFDGKHIEETVSALIVDVTQGKVGPDQVTPELSMRRDLGLDSLGLSTLLLRFGEALGQDPDEFIELLLETPINTVADIIALGERARRGAGA